MMQPYTAEAAKAGWPDDASLGMLWHKEGLDVGGELGMMLEQEPVC